MTKSDHVEKNPLSSSQAAIQIGRKMQQIAEQAHHWKAMAEQVANPSIMAIGKWARQPSIAQARNIAANAQASMPAIAPIMTAYKESLARINIGRLQSLGVLHPELGDCIAQLGKLASAHKTLLESQTKAGRPLPDFVLPGATRELYLSAAILESISEQNGPPDQIQQVHDRVDGSDETEALKLLRTVAPDLCKAYLGAKHALGSSSPDKARHMLTSLREVWNHLLRRLAPSDDVLAWIQRTTHKKQGLIHNDKPTRRAQGLYICRGFECSPLREFVLLDISSLTKMIDLLNRLHEPDPSINDTELHAVMAKSDSALGFILKLVDYQERPV
ncbi:hypothetical protein PuT2_11330 [Pusillimonas sp. T2]|uniref:pPIWI-associating nuclease domain-containing protein n=1 Tax=Pusillimonas sp. T2 TaxID=1548123 RepID=UPI000B9D01E0|nr:hypothetical protein [Pusillimonas sp. T2]OXR48559.1 hypothetical protein PuT2_11330 [Pusillimonas sp. T2]